MGKRKGNGIRKEAGEGIEDTEGNGEKGEVGGKWVTECEEQDRRKRRQGKGGQDAQKKRNNSCTDKNRER